MSAVVLVAFTGSLHTILAEHQHRTLIILGLVAVEALWCLLVAAAATVARRERAGRNRAGGQRRHNPAAPSLLGPPRTVGGSGAASRTDEATPKASTKDRPW
ncbi:MAG: hypothetical protein ACRBK7_20805 [Acidimicrobiales bacterium]